MTGALQHCSGGSHLSTPAGHAPRGRQGTDFECRSFGCDASMMFTHFHDCEVARV